MRQELRHRRHEARDGKTNARRSVLIIEREFAPDADAVRHAFAILLRQGERKDVAA